MQSYKSVTRRSVSSLRTTTRYIFILSQYLFSRARLSSFALLFLFLFEVDLLLNPARRLLFLYVHCPSIEGLLVLLFISYIHIYIHTHSRTKPFLSTLGSILIFCCIVSHHIITSHHIISRRIVSSRHVHSHSKGSTFYPGARTSLYTFIPLFRLSRLFLNVSLKYLHDPTDRC